jgi:hypothetical protein
METGQDVEAYRGQPVSYVYHVPGGGGSTQAAWYCARSPQDPPAAVLLSLDEASGISMLTTDADLDVTVTLTAAQTDSLPGVGMALLHTELWLTPLPGSDPVPVATGTMTLKDSVRPAG